MSLFPKFPFPGQIRNTSALHPAAFRSVLFLAASAILLAAISFENSTVSALQPDANPKVGEKLTYSISFNNFDIAGYAEIHVVSKGKLEGRDAVELSAKLKSVDLVSAAFYTWDESRTTFIAPETGYPLLVKELANTGPFPRETTRSYLEQPSTAFDLLSMIYRVRSLGGAGSFSVLEDERIHNFDFVISGQESVSTEAGDFDTQISTVQSSFLTEEKIRDFRVNFTSDDRKIPVLVRFRTEVGDFEARLAGIQDLTPAPDPTATPVPTPTPVVTPTPVPTPRPYVDNQPLSPDLPFRLGESLDYQVTKQGIPAAIVTLSASERKQYLGVDSLRLVAQVTETLPANDLFGATDRIEAWVDPDTLVPFATTLGFAGALSEFSQQTLFDQTQGTATVQAGAPVQIPIGTHNVLTLAYAVRAFNLRPPIGAPNPSNDTRVALFAGTEAKVITLRPSVMEQIEVSGKKWQANVITIRTGEPQVDAMNIRVWLSADGRRLPLRLEAGPYRADLLKVTNGMDRSSP
ncbi:MAG: DUF3108 domain-containing protein [Acidobacteriota bacterium]|nr:MAG: DUF3108 domain-containing protein [Acidobacteriota bacterium]